jgi:hypothetical protein
MHGGGSPPTVKRCQGGWLDSHHTVCIGVGVQLPGYSRFTDTALATEVALEMTLEVMEVI